MANENACTQLSGDAALLPISDHCDSDRFFNPGMHINRSWVDVLRWRMTSRVERWPRTVEINPLELPPEPDQDGIAVHWGTFQLTDEGREAPPEALAETGIPDPEFRVLDPGQTIYV